MHSKFRPAKYLKNNPHKKPRDGNTEKDFGYANCCEEERSSRDPAEDKHQGNTDNGERGVHQQNLDENIENERCHKVIHIEIFTVASFGSLCEARFQVVEHVLLELTGLLRRISLGVGIPLQGAAKWDDRARELARSI